MISLSVMVPTCGRASLARTLESIVAGGLSSEDEVIIVGDGRQPAAHGIAMAWMSKIPLYYFEIPQTKCAGGPQRNAAMEIARGRLLLAIDDDDAYRPGALDVVRAAAAANPRALADLPDGVSHSAASLGDALEGEGSVARQRRNADDRRAERA